MKTNKSRKEEAQKKSPKTPSPKKKAYSTPKVGTAKKIQGFYLS